MRILAFAVAGLLAAAPSAAADPRGDLQAKGEQLAKDGRFGEAIDQFKAADRIEPRASHACLIALAYTRKEQWPQAELFLALCHRRATPTDPLPVWVPELEKQLKDRLAAVNVTEVSITVTPAAAHPLVTVSSFAPDEVFEPQTIHLPPGTHVIFAKADGYPDKQYTLEIRDRTPQHVAIDLAPPTTAVPPGGAGAIGGGPGPGQPRSEPRPSRAGTYLMIGGAVVGVAGVFTHIKMAQLRNKMEESPEAWDENKDGFERARGVTIAFYTVSAGLLVTGYLLRRHSKQEASVHVGVAPLPEGGMFATLEWAR